MVRTKGIDRLDVFFFCSRKWIMVLDFVYSVKNTSDPVVYKAVPILGRAGVDVSSWSMTKHHIMAQTAAKRNDE